VSDFGGLAISYLLAILSTAVEYNTIQVLETIERIIEHIDHA
jgi:hypothetical protein